ncbi:MAG: hypothetical protein H6R19_1506 [Proteobacteria bacterium]|nr:hypothetical protein [Pseudomonadota bacterium]
MERYTAPIRTAIARLNNWKLVVLVLIAASAITALFAQYVYSDARRGARMNLAIIAKLKANEVERWLTEKRSGLVQPPSGYLALALAEWQKGKPGPDANAALVAHLNFYLQRYQDASGIAVYDAQGRFVMCTEATHTAMPMQIETRAILDGPAHLIDFHADPAGQPHLAFSTPLLLHHAHGNQLIGFLLLEIDPARYLYPFIQNWPGNSTSAETLLYRRIGNEVEFLNPLRHDPAPPLTKRVSLSNQGLLASRLVNGPAQAAEGMDYRGVKVFGASHLIKNTPWQVLTKMDRSEIYADAFNQTIRFGIFALLLAMGLTLLLRQTHARARSLASLRQQTADMALLRAFIDCVPETLFMAHRDGQIRIINTTGAARLGHTPEQIVGANIWALLPPGVSHARKATAEEACRSNQTRSLSDQRNGIEYLSMFYPLGDGEHVVLIATDVTARNADAKARREAMQTLQGFIDHMPGFAYVKNHEARILLANQRFQDQLGINPVSMIGKRPNEIFPDAIGQKILAEDLRVLAQGTPEVIEEEISGRFYESTKFLIPAGEGNVNLGGITLDVTARHQAEEALRRSEERLRLLTDNLPDSFLYQIAQEADGTRRFLFVSSGVERVLGVLPEEAVKDNKAILDRIDPDQLDELRVAQEQAVNGNFSLDLHIRRADGRWGWLNMRSHLRARQTEQEPRIWDGVASDVTALRHSEQLLALQARRAGVLLALPAQAEQMDEAAFMSHAQDLAEQLTDSQIAFIHFVKEDQENIELVAWSHNTIAHYCKAAFEKHYPLSKAGIWADSARLKQAVIVNDYAHHAGQHGLPAGHSPLHRLISVPVMEGGLVRMIAGVGNKTGDYTDLDAETVQLIANETWRIVRKRRAELALQQTVQVVEASPAICFRWYARDDRPVAFVSDNVRNWGYEPQDLIAGHPPYTTLVHPDDLARVIAEVSTHRTLKHTQYKQEYRLLKADGDVIWVSDLTTVRHDDKGNPKYFDGIVTDISERKLYELRLAENLATQQALNKKLEDAHNQLLQAEKLSAIGQLAAGVAHEINNPIGFVHSNLGTLNEYVATLINLCDTYTNLFEETQPDDTPLLFEIRRIKQEQDYNYLRSDIFPLLEESREGLIRVRKIVQDLRDFSRSGPQEWGAADLHKGLDSTLNIVANELKYKCHIHKEYGNIPEVVCVISQINQVFMNLLVNAAQSIKTQGLITLRSGMEGTDHVWVSISDSGEGIPPENLNHIFEPFFTTKPVGVGTGLGLSLVFGIITRHHGRIDVSSEPGKGSTFRITLPVTQAPEINTQPVQEAP